MYKKIITTELERYDNFIRGILANPDCTRIISSIADEFEFTDMQIPQLDDFLKTFSLGLEDYIDLVRNIELELKKNITIDQLNVVIVDDEPDILEEIALLVFEGQKLAKIPKISRIKTTSAEEALRKISNRLKKNDGWKPNIILSDIYMDGMDGKEFCATIRTDPEFAAISTTPFFFISAHVKETKKMLEAYKTGADQVHSKPLDTEVFPYIIKNTLSLIVRENEKTSMIEILAMMLGIILAQTKRIIENRKSLLQQMEVAKRLQCSLLPQKTTKIKNITLDYIHKSMDAIGGDFIDWYYSNTFQDKLGFFICDVSGHGVPAAMISSMIKIAVDTSWGSYVQENHPNKALLHIKKQIIHKMGKNYFTGYLGYINLNNGELVFARAAHPYIIIAQADGSFRHIESKGPWIDGEKITLLPVPEEKINLLQKKHPKIHSSISEYFLYDFKNKVYEFKDHLFRIETLIESSEIPFEAKADLIKIVNDANRFKYEEVRLKLNPGDKIILYTDGVNEARNPEGEMLGGNEYNGWDYNKINKWFKDNIDFSQPPKVITRTTIEQLCNYTQKTSFADDIAIFVIEYTPAP